MLGLSALLLFVMGILAGIVNAAVGSGSLLTLPVLLALGVPPGVAVRTNTIGMSFATIASVLGFRKEIAAEKRHLVPLSITTIVSASAGSVFGSLAAADAAVKGNDRDAMWALQRLIVEISRARRSRA